MPFMTRRIKDFLKWGGMEEVEAPDHEEQGAPLPTWIGQRKLSHLIPSFSMTQDSVDLLGQMHHINTF